MPVHLSVFIASSLDGYIADASGSLAWLESAVDPAEEYGYEAFLASVDALAMGRGTYDHIAHLDPLPFGDRPVFVFTHRQARPRPGVTFWQESAEAAVERWADTGLERVYVDGGRLIAGFLGAGLIDDMVITTAPVLLGDGLPLFPPTGIGSSWALDSVRSWPSGVVQRRYVRA